MSVLQGESLGTPAQSPDIPDVTIGPRGPVAGSRPHRTSGTGTGLDVFKKYSGS